MATGIVKNGTDIILAISGQRIAALTANGENYNAAMLDITTKDSAGDSESAPGLRSADFDCSGLFQEHSINIIKRSEDFSNAIWVKDSTVTVTANTEAAPAPYNTKVVDLITFNSGTFVKQAIVNGLFDSSLSVCFSIWVKGTGAINIEVIGDSSSSSTSVTLSGTWQRVSVSHITGANTYAYINTNTATSVSVFGAQFEQGTTPSQYVPSGYMFDDLLAFEIAGTKIPCTVTSNISGELIMSGNALISSIKKTNAKDSNITFTCALKVTGPIAPSTI